MLLDSAAKVLPGTNQLIFRKSIDSFVNTGHVPVIAYKAINDAVSKVPEDLVKEFIELLPKTPEIIQDVKYAFIKEIDPLFTILMSEVNQQYRTVYNSYKATLSLLRTTMEVVDPLTYTNALAVLQDKMQVPISANLVIFSDVHYFLHLLRIFREGLSPTKVYPFPQFSAEEYKQLTGYLSEICDILTVMCYINVKTNVDINFFQDLPITRTINKKPAHFFGQPISKNTYSILLNYLSAVNQCLTNTFAAEYTKLSYTNL